MNFVDHLESAHLIEGAMSLRLFDEIKEPYSLPKRHSEGSWTYLNRTTSDGFDYVRHILQQWFDEYEATPKKKELLQQQFRSHESERHLDAFFELYLHRMLKRIGFEVNIEPKIGERYPDFSIITDSNQEIIVEAKSIYPSDWFGSEKGIENSVIDYLDKNLYSPQINLGIKFLRTSSKTLPYSKLLKRVQSWISKLDVESLLRRPSSEYIDNPEKLEYCERDSGWQIEFTAYPIREHIHGERHTTIQLFGAQVFAPQDGKSLNRAIGRKNAHYGQLNRPYVLAINFMSSTLDLDDVFDALFGTLVHHIYDDGSDDYSRLPDGAWWGPRGPQKQRMSGILLFKRLYPTSLGRVKPVLWHNPYAEFPIQPSTFPFKQQILRSEDRTMQLIEGTFTPTILGIEIDRMPF
jgi:hypothetical protein